MSDQRSPWQNSSSTLVANSARLDGDVDVDVCVIGAGMAGMLCALELAERGRSVTVLERQGVAAGDTSMTTAHLTALLDARYHALAGMHGDDVIRDVAASHTRAIAHLERLTNTYEIECDFQRVSGFLCAGSPEQVATLEKECLVAREAGINCELISRPPLPIASGPALHVPNQAQFDAVRFLTGIVRVLERRGVVIYAPVTVQSVEPTDAAGQISLRTSAGHTVRANHVVVATGSPINNLVAIHTKQAAYRTYAISSAISGGGAALYWDMEDPYHYVRTATDVATGRRVVIVGGEDHRVGQDADNEQCFQRLEDWLRDHVGQAGEIVSRWSGQVFETDDGLAFIGRNPGQERVFVVTGESGNGMTYSGVASQLIADLVQGVPNPLEKIYDPARKPHSMAALGRFVRENLNTVGQYSDWVAPADMPRTEDIPRGQGAVLRRGLRRIAVYVDDAGTAHEYSATCPHLGGVVAWNHVEKSWDCPCHGSRFDCHGKVLQGPAVNDLSSESTATASDGQAAADAADS